jgi:hypothetical protein
MATYEPIGPAQHCSLAFAVVKMRRRRSLERVNPKVDHEIAGPVWGFISEPDGRSDFCLFLAGAWSFPVNVDGHFMVHPGAAPLVAFGWLAMAT